MVLVSYSKLTEVSLLLLEDVSVFFDYFEVGDDVCNTVYLFRNRTQIAVIRFEKSVEFMRIMGEI
jgi:hypothetical protein